ncbi:MAG: PqqD family protein [Ruminococcaceae bacterium]|nr:PqqD family protein [Oscillospiraceae bacterium]
MKIKNGFVVKNVGDLNYVVATGELTQSFNSMIRLNGTARFLWDLLAEPTDVDAMVAAMTQKYDIDADTARRDVEGFVEVLKSKGIIEE